MVKRGEVYKIKLGSEGVGSEQRGDRYAVVVQNDTGNFYSTTTIVALITAQEHKADIPTHIDISSIDSGVPEPSIIMCEQIRTVDKQRLGEKVGELTKRRLVEMNNALCVSLSLRGIRHDRAEEDIA